METMADGGLHGFPVVDVEVTVDDGKYHAVDSSEMAFKLAARAGFRDAFESAGPVVLEPVSKVAITVPSEFQGDVMGDIASREDQCREPLLGTAAVRSWRRSYRRVRSQIRNRSPLIDPRMGQVQVVIRPLPGAALAPRRPCNG